MAESKSTVRLSAFKKGYFSSLRLNAGDKINESFSYVSEADPLGRHRRVLVSCKCGKTSIVILSHAMQRPGWSCVSCGNAKRSKSKRGGATPEERFWAKVNKGSAQECWSWNGAVRSLGYGHMHWHGRCVAAHRIAYELIVGPIPAGLVLDHLCRNPNCVNPKHLEPVTQRTNVIVRGIGPFAERAKQTHCLRGHQLSGDNLYIHKSRGVRICRQCHREREREKSKRMRDQQNVSSN